MKMMKKAGFTLVELIVVITILAILGTIAFISLQGNTQDAKNSKVTSDLRTLASAIEIAVTKGEEGVTLRTLKAGSQTDTSFSTNYATGATAFSGVTLTGGTTGYNVGTINFINLKQNGEDFKDPDGNDYLYSYATNAGTAYYQIAGEVNEVSGDITKYIKGNYIQEATTDSVGLISMPLSVGASSNNPSLPALSNTGAVTNGRTGTGTLY